MADAQRRGSGTAEDILERGAPFDERAIAEVCLPIAQDVEGDERDGVRRARRGGEA
jgi:hypothetical protein